MIYTSRSQSITEGYQNRIEAVTIEEHHLLASLLAMIGQLPYMTWAYCVRMLLSTVDWTLSHKSSSRQSLTHMNMGQSNLGGSTIEIPVDCDRLSQKDR